MEDSAASQDDQIRGVDPSAETENSQEGSTSQDVEVKEEPEDNGYEQSSSANSRESSPLPPVHFGVVSPEESNASPLPDGQESTNQPAVQNNCSDLKVGPQKYGAKAERKMNSVLNIVEGLRRKSETQMAVNNSTEARSSSYRSKTVLDGVLEKHEPAFPSLGQNSVFPISHKLQARLTTDKKDSLRPKQHIARPNSPTRKCNGLLKDKTHFTYAVMESSVDEDEAAKIFNVQNHELVCAIGSKSLVADGSKGVIASLDLGYYWCNFCPYTTNTKDLLIQHVLEHRFGCKYCPYESFCRSDTIRHMHKMHPAFEESANHLVYCTLLSDYMRVKARVCGQMDKDPDEDVYDPDIGEFESVMTERTSRKRKLVESSLSDIKSVRSSIESPTTPSWSDSESSFKEKGKSRKSQNPRKHAPPSKTDYDVFSMEVEEVKNNRQELIADSAYSDKTVPPSEESASDVESHSIPPGTMQVLPTMTDGSLQTFTSKPVVPKTAAIPPRANFSYRGRKASTNVSGTASSLYWSCGYCTFQSNSQAEIKEHSNKGHPGKPHRYVALIKNMTPETYITPKAHGTLAGNLKHSAYRPALSGTPTNGAQGLEETDFSFKDRFSSQKKRDNTLYRCYHCNYTARRHSSLKTHIYHKHRGKGLVAVEDESETGQQMFFCARDDCTFKSDNPGMYLNHVEQCTPWNKPELADVEVEPHIRDCLDQTIAFAETAREKVNHQCLSTWVTIEAGKQEKAGANRDDNDDVELLLQAPSKSGDKAHGSSSSRQTDKEGTESSRISFSAHDAIESIKDNQGELMQQPVSEAGLCDFVPLQRVTTEDLTPCERHNTDSNHFNAANEVSKAKESISPACDSFSTEDVSVMDYFIPVGFVDDAPPRATTLSVAEEDEVLSTCHTGIHKNMTSDRLSHTAINLEAAHSVKKLSKGKQGRGNLKSVKGAHCKQPKQTTKHLSQGSYSGFEKTSCATMADTEPLPEDVGKHALFNENVANILQDDPLLSNEKYHIGHLKNSMSADTRWLQDLIDSTSTDNTDTEEPSLPLATKEPLAMPITPIFTDNSYAKASGDLRANENQLDSEERTENYCAKDDVNNGEGRGKSDQGVILENSKFSLDVSQQTETDNRVPGEEREKGVKPSEDSLGKLCFSFVPARSSAKKALTKMKSTLVEDSESDDRHASGKKYSKELPLKSKRPHVGIKINLKAALGQCSLLQSKVSPANCSRDVAGVSSFHVRQLKNTFMCEYCVDVDPSSLRKIKDHLLLKHKSMPLSVIRCANKRWRKKSRYFVCPQPSCYKLCSTTKELETHQKTHHVFTHKKPKERTTYNSSSSTTANSHLVRASDSATSKKDFPPPHPSHPPTKMTSLAEVSKPTPKAEIRSCRVELQMLNVSQMQGAAHSQKRDGKYQCLYCTEYVYENSLSAMKSHYIQEHEGQLMVVRDTEARRSQLPSRLYVCSTPGCEYSCISRHDLDTHARSEHSASSCSYVYQCAVCGWYSSSHSTATQHLHSQHSPSEGASLVHMQVMVDKYGHTSKKIV